MKIQSLLFENGKWINPERDNNPLKAQLVLFFASKSAMANPAVYDLLRNKFPDSIIAGCTTAGEILNEEVLDNSAVSAAIQFKSTQVKIAYQDIVQPSQSFETGKQLAGSVPHKGLKAVFVLSDGQIVNGSELVRGFEEKFPSSVIVTGGLAGDGDKFKETFIAANCPPVQGRVALIAFYGDQLQVSHGSAGGWDSFGPYRQISRSNANILYELDRQPALELYKKYLGEEAANLPASALLFPLMIKSSASTEEGMVRTILSVNEKENSMTFAGDVPEGYVAKLMVTNFDKLIDGAHQAAKYARQGVVMRRDQEKLAILISCVGRKLLLGERAEDEVVSTRSVFDQRTRQIGFYSYGEISPHLKTGRCELHNQTMTITTISENYA